MADPDPLRSLLPPALDGAGRVMSKTTYASGATRAHGRGCEPLRTEAPGTKKARAPENPESPRMPSGRARTRSYREVVTNSAVLATSSGTLMRILLTVSELILALKVFWKRIGIVSGLALPSRMSAPMLPAILPSS